MKRIVTLAASCLIVIGLQAQSLQKPILLSPALGDTAQDVNVLLNWQPALGGLVSGYDVEVDEDTLFLNPQMALVNGTTARPSELDFGKKYYWRVKANSSTGSSPYSDIRSFTTFENEFTGMSPIGLNKSPRQSISWDTLPGVLSYEYELSINANMSSPSTGVVQHPDNSNIFPQLEFNETYYWRVRTIHGKDVSNWSNTVNFTVRNEIALKFPPDSADLREPETILACANVAGVLEYIFQVDIDSLFNPNSPDLVTTTILDIDFDNSNDIQYFTSRLRFGTKYYWRVQGVNNLGKSAWSSHRTFTTLDKATLSLPTDGSDSVNVVTKLTWFKIEGAGGYTIEIDTDNSFPNPLNEQLKDDTTTSYLLVLNNWVTDFYYWRVKAWHSRDTSGWSDPFSFKVHPVGVKEQNLIENISVYPNPAINFVRVEFPDNIEHNVTLTLFSITGKQIKELKIGDLLKGSGTLEFDVSEYEKGVYLLQFDSNGMTSTKKIIVQ